MFSSTQNVFYFTNLFRLVLEIFRFFENHAQNLNAPQNNSASGDLQLGLTAGTYRWDLQLGLTAGTYRWDLQMGLTAETYRWDLQMGFNLAFKGLNQTEQKPA
jgi:hypothetical protein